MEHLYCIHCIIKNDLYKSMIFDRKNNMKLGKFNHAQPKKKQRIQHANHNHLKINNKLVSYNNNKP